MMPEPTASTRFSFRSLDRLATRSTEWLLHDRAFRIAILGYLILLFALRGFIFPGGPNDDSEQLLYSQSFEIGYDVSNPPLYTWLVIVVQKIAGVSLATVVFVKFALLAVTYLLLHQSARLMLRHERWAVAAALSPLALYYVAWDVPRNFSHSVLLMASCVASFYLLLRLERAPHLLSYLALGLAFGVGVMAKLNFLVFASALLLACLCDRRLRARVLDWRMALTLALPAIMILPFGLWMFDRADAVAAAIATKFEPSLVPWYDLALGTLGSLLFSLLEFLSPLVLLLPVIFWRALLPLRPGLGAVPAPEAGAAPGTTLRYHRFLLIFLSLLLFELLLVALVSGAQEVQNHLFFIFILFPLWFFCRVDLADPDPVTANRFAFLVLVLALVVPLVMVVKFVTDPLNEGRKPYFNVPYPALAEELRGVGFTEGTIFTVDYPYPLSGNLRLRFPDSRVITTKYRLYDPPARSLPGQCLVIWEIDRNPDLDQTMTAAAAQRLGVDGEDLGPDTTLEVPMVNGWGRSVRFRVRLYPQGSGSCR